MAETRKRQRSDGEEFGVQTKYFVNQKMFEKSDRKIMQGIHEKTLNILFAGAKLQSQQKIEDNNNNISETALDTIDDKLSEAQGCQLCCRNIDESSNFSCKNCDLKVCRTCRTNCRGCSFNLCCNCVVIFGCSIGDVPFCEECKLYVN